MRTTLILLFTLCSIPASAGSRFALVLGNNEGAPGRTRLWFAERDASRFARSLRELGDFPEENLVTLTGGDVDGVRRALDQLERQMAAARKKGERALLLVYFSGHASAAGLELGPERLAYDELRARLVGSHADVRLAIVDACDSGALTQVKGGAPAPEINFPIPGEEPVEGMALVASTALGELAQESSTLGGSFFSHHLEVGLRGAADADGDGRVTLNEAFRYTAAHTVSGTASTEIGAQHPTYDMRMSGRGDVVLADLRRAEATLTLPTGAASHYLLRGRSGFIAEVPGSTVPVTLALPAGMYRVERRTGALREVAELTLVAGESRLLPPGMALTARVSRPKGGSRFWPEVFGGAAVVTSVFPRTGAGLEYRVGARQPVGPWALRLGVGHQRRHVQDAFLGFDMTSTRAALALLFPLLDTRLRVELGPELGYAWVTQKLMNRAQYASGDVNAGLVTSTSLRFGSLGVSVDVSATGHLFTLNGVRAIRPTFGAGLLLSYAL